MCQKHSRYGSYIGEQNRQKISMTSWSLYPSTSLQIPSENVYLTKEDAGCLS